MRRMVLTAVISLVLWSWTHGEEYVLRLDVIDAEFGADPKPGAQPKSIQNQTMEFLVRPNFPFHWKSTSDGKSAEVRGCLRPDEEGWIVRVDITRSEPTDTSFPDGTPVCSNSRTNTEVSVEAGESFLVGGTITRKTTWEKPRHLFSRRRLVESNAAEHVLISLDAYPAEDERREQRVDRLREAALRWKSKATRSTREGTLEFEEEDAQLWPND